MVKYLIPSALMLSMLSGCGNDPVQQAYDDCMAQVSQVEAQASNDAMKGMIEGIQKMAESACGLILSTCEADLESTLCKGMIGKYVDNE